jgi:hypothetical protein
MDKAGAAVVARTYGSSHTRFTKSATDFATQTYGDAILQPGVDGPGVLAVGHSS